MECTPQPLFDATLHGRHAGAFVIYRYPKFGRLARLRTVPFTTSAYALFPVAPFVRFKRFGICIYIYILVGMSGTHNQPSSGSHGTASGDTASGGSEGLNQLLQLLSQAVQQGSANASTSQGPSLRDLPKDAFKLPTFSGERSGNERIRPAHVRTFLWKLDKCLKVYEPGLYTVSLKLSSIGRKKGFGSAMFARVTIFPAYCRVES